MKYILFIFLFITSFKISFSQEALRGTTIMVVMRNNDIYIGADSKLLGSDGINIVDTIGCKILKFDDLVFTHSGIYSSAGEYDINEEIKKIVHHSNTIEEIQLKFHARLLEILESEVKNYLIFNTISKRDSLIFLKTTPVYAYFKDGIATLDIFNYSVIVDTLNKYEINYDSVKIQILPNERKSYYSIIGHNLFSSSFFNTLKEEDMLDSAPPYLLIEKLIELEIKYNKFNVGYPIDIIRLKNSNIEWVKCKEGCE